MRLSADIAAASVVAKRAAADNQAPAMVWLRQSRGIGACALRALVVENKMYISAIPGVSLFNLSSVVEFFA